MTTNEKTKVTVEAVINAPVEKVWKLWSEPKHIVNWNSASDDWHTPKSENDLRPGGIFSARMESKDGSMGFDFSGKYDKVEPLKLIEFTLDDGRKVQVTFESKGENTKIREVFEAEDTNSVEMQRSGWQTIMDNFKKYVENYDKLESLHFEIRINAEPETVYSTLIDKKHYSEWTSEFSHTSHFIGSWEKGSTIHFMGTDEHGNMGGMISKVKENIPNKFVSLQHVGMIQNGKEITTGEEVEIWVGATENYTITRTDNATLFAVDSDSNQEFKSYFYETWPKALNKLKEICEQIH